MAVQLIAHQAAVEVGTIDWVTGFVLTPERREELSDLLGDETRFRTSYPRVAEYLDTAAAIPGSGDAEADRAFDIRLLHYMTGGDSENPYWDIVGPSVSVAPAERGGRREVNGGVAKGSARLAYAQTVLQEAYAYAIPSPETLEWITAVCAGRGLLEIGAGRGYWAEQLRRRGVDVLAFDSEPPGQIENVSFRGGAGQLDVWHEVGDLAGLAAAREAGEESRRVLFLCWPPGWGDPMSADALEAFEEAGGDTLIYVGEPRGGKTGTDAFFDKLASGWEQVGEDTQFVSWWNLHDRAESWTRRK
ncbi:hypothetical protein ABZW96_21400 [Nocardia sp. NPDC004168]|uniref:hypothetical protein n=1 Tax=Nocardia sp. NPDC004168 TaxID=3154452 RepID=UPI0033BC7D1E